MARVGGGLLLLLACRSDWGGAYPPHKPSPLTPPPLNHTCGAPSQLNTHSMAGRQYTSRRPPCLHGHE